LSHAYLPCSPSSQNVGCPAAIFWVKAWQSTWIRTSRPQGCFHQQRGYLVLHPSPTGQFLPLLYSCRVGSCVNPCGPSRPVSTRPPFVAAPHRAWPAAGAAISGEPTGLPYSALCLPVSLLLNTCLQQLQRSIRSVRANGSYCAVGSVSAGRLCRAKATSSAVPKCLMEFPRRLIFLRVMLWSLIRAENFLG
jgi:hypothetical protein